MALRDGKEDNENTEQASIAVRLLLLPSAEDKTGTWDMPPSSKSSRGPGSHDDEPGAMHP